MKGLVENLCLKNLDFLDCLNIENVPKSVRTCSSRFWCFILMCDIAIEHVFARVT